MHSWLLQNSFDHSFVLTTTNKNSKQNELLVILWNRAHEISRLWIGFHYRDFIFPASVLRMQKKFISANCVTWFLCSTCGACSMCRTSVTELIIKMLRLCRLFWTIFLLSFSPSFVDNVAMRCREWNEMNVSKEKNSSLWFFVSSFAWLIFQYFLSQFLLSFFILFCSGYFMKFIRCHVSIVAAFYLVWLAQCERVCISRKRHEKRMCLMKK